MELTNHSLNFNKKIRRSHRGRWDSLFSTTTSWISSYFSVFSVASWCPPC